MIGLWRALVIESHHKRSLSTAAAATRPNHKRTQWRSRIQGLISYPNEELVDNYVQGIAVQALNEVKEELNNLGWEADVIEDSENHRVWIEIKRQEYVDFWYEIRRVTKSEEHTSELQSRPHLVCRLLL